MMMLSDVLHSFDGKKVCLAKALGISKQAVSKWDPEKPIPEKHALKLRYEILPSKLRKVSAKQ